MYLVLAALFSLAVAEEAIPPQYLSEPKTWKYKVKIPDDQFYDMWDRGQLNEMPFYGRGSVTEAVFTRIDGDNMEIKLEKKSDYDKLLKLVAAYKPLTKAELAVIAAEKARKAAEKAAEEARQLVEKCKAADCDDGCDIKTGKCTCPSTHILGHDGKKCAVKYQPFACKTDADCGKTCVKGACTCNTWPPTHILQADGSCKEMTGCILKRDGSGILTMGSYLVGRRSYDPEYAKVCRGGTRLSCQLGNPALFKRKRCCYYVNEGGYRVNNKAQCWCVNEVTGVEIPGSRQPKDDIKC